LRLLLIAIDEGYTMNGLRFTLIEGSHKMFRAGVIQLPDPAVKIFLPSTFPQRYINLVPPEPEMVVDLSNAKDYLGNNTPSPSSTGFFSITSDSDNSAYIAPYWLNTFILQPPN
jgi:hypothetical protein